MNIKIDKNYKELERRRRNIIIASIVLTVFFVGNLFIFKEISRASQFFNPYLFLIIINIDVVFFLVILAISLRHLIKLFFENKEKRGKLRIKLSIILISMIFIPAITISTVSITLISDATNFWFSGKVEKALQGAKDVVNQVIKNEKQKLELAGNLLKLKETNPYNIKKIFNLKAITFTNKKGIPDKIYGKPLSFKNLDLNKEFVQIGNYFRYITKTKDGRYIILDEKIPEFLINKEEELREISSVFNQFRHYKKPIRVSYIVTILTITMFVIGGAIWFGQYIVRNLTYPLEKLVEASKKLASGDLNVKVNVKSSDEIGILIEEFNHMVKELKSLYIALEKSNRELKFNKEYLEAILENARTGVVYTDRNGNIIKINKAAEKLLNIKKDQIIGKPINELLDILNVDKNNLYKENTIEINGKIVIIKATKLFKKGTLLVLDDITDVLIAEKAKSWREIAQRIAHEIKNPLTPIKLAAERIERQFKKKNENFEKILEKSVNVIYTEVDHLSKLVKDFRQLATNEKIKQEEINLKQLLNEIKNSYSTDKFKVNIEIPDNLYIKGDKKLLRQAFSNIIQNSYEKLIDGGEVKISAKEKNKKIIITIKDNGEGIPKEEIDKIFIPYYSKKAKGSGLGLTITKDIIERHQGKIAAISSEDGAIFEIILPKA